MRLVMADRATWRELRTFWDINEVWEANELLNIQADAEWLAEREMRNKPKPGR